jgi:hypothetical protein
MAKHGAEYGMKKGPSGGKERHNLPYYGSQIRPLLKSFTERIDEDLLNRIP